MTLQPCPNEECRGECTLELYTAGHDGTPGLYRAECSSATCAYCGPVSYDPEQAIALHNRMPRTEPWVSVAERMPELGDTIEVWDREHDHWVATIEAVKGDDSSFTEAYPLHVTWFGPCALEVLPECFWRPHTPPRGPVSR